MNYNDRLWDRYRDWAEENYAQLLELYDDDKKPPWVGFLIQGTPVPAPNGLIRLAIRADDTNSDPCELAKDVVVNRYGWYYTERPVPKKPITIKDWNFDM